MKEKKYKLPEDKGAAFVGEPTVAYHGNAAVAFPEEEYADDVEEKFEDETDDFDWDKMPYLDSPTNEEEAVAQIEAIEEEYEKTGISYSLEEVIENTEVPKLKRTGRLFIDMTMP